MPTTNWEEAHYAAAAGDREPLALNVGGQEFITTRRTLMAEPSLLRDTASATYTGPSSSPYKFFDGQHPAVIKLGMSKITYKAYFQGTSLAIDRDGTHFRHILNHLRDNDAVLPRDSAVLRELLVEARAYELESLVNKIVHEMRDW